ncbi:MAG: 4-hydroxybenzoate polyprenyltransferase [Deltaproteobacteria bacterium]|nr:MAG: 4-hydroxybenzoate polyprenyltransferase [Deltaproteobacteria bacterium]PIE72476.1 MAG: 4-hydroxybenzoate polyprenyltransferase [Deltaproteobacteria bacterium]
MKEATPLIVDLDKTLIYTDSLVESVVLLIKKNPVYFFIIFFWLFKGKARLKTEIVNRVSLDIETLPYNKPFIEWLKVEKEKGRKLYLVTAAHKEIAKKVMNYLNFFDGFFATEESCNLKGSKKCALIKEKIGDDFVYAGDSKVDLLIWKDSEAAVLVNAPSSLANEVRKKTIIEAEFPRKKIGIRTWLRALRIHQWVKNILLFVPLLTAFEFLNVFKIFSVIFAFLAYSLVASGTYVLNDIFDLNSDRAHMLKRHRPFACGDIQIINGIVIAGIFFILALTIALYISEVFTAILAFYFILTVTYSLFFKKHIIIDVIILSFLYTLRIIAGVTVIQVDISSWLFAFSMFLFLSLALIKRCGELVSFGKEDQKRTIVGRDYMPSDLVVLWPLGVGASLLAIVVLSLFINAPETQQKYASPELLWGPAVVIMYWLGRMWIKTSRGEIDDDPILYVIKDSISYMIFFFTISITIISYFYTI